MDKLRWGLIGCGDISEKRVAPALTAASNCELVAVNRANFEKADEFAARFNARRAVRDWEDLVSDKEIDAVYIATPVHLHAKQTIAAAKAGKHVLCEKPMALNPSECSEMIEACRTNNVRLGIAYYRHFYPVIDYIKEILKSGEIGIPVVTQINAFERFDPLPSNPRQWLLDKSSSGGGPMFDFGCHRIEVFQNVIGEIVSVRSLMDNVLFKRKVEDTASAIFRFKSGAEGTLCVAHATAEPQDTFHIFCSKGSLHMDNLNSGSLIVRTEDAERIETHPAHNNLHHPLIADFVEAVLSGRDPVVTGEIGLNVNRVLELIYKDAQNQ